MGGENYLIPMGEVYLSLSLSEFAAFSTYVKLGDTWIETNLRHLVIASFLERDASICLSPLKYFAQ